MKCEDAKNTKEEGSRDSAGEHSALDSPVKGWSMYDGTGQTNPTTGGDSDVPPYRTGLEALHDGWRVIQFPQLIPPYPNMEYTTSFQKYEFIFEQLVDLA